MEFSIKSEWFFSVSLLKIEASVKQVAVPVAHSLDIGLISGETESYLRMKLQIGLKKLPGKGAFLRVFKCRQRSIDFLTNE
jgi:hypothetical protein